MMDIKQSRTEFEQALRKLDLARKFEQDGFGVYYDGDTEKCWKLWQASTKDVSITRPIVRMIHSLYGLAGWCYNADLDEDYRQAELFLSQHEHMLDQTPPGQWEDYKT